eukprot:1194884-Prorocentrum_minimum.AAC.3
MLSSVYRLPPPSEFATRVTRLPLRSGEAGVNSDQTTNHERTHAFRSKGKLHASLSYVIQLCDPTQGK